MPRLAQIADIGPGLDWAEIRTLDEIVSFVSMASVSETSGTVVSEEPRALGDVLQGFTTFKDGDILVAKITPCFENGKIAHARIKARIGFGSTEFHVVRPKAETLDNRYLFHFLRQPRVRKAGERRMTGSAGQRRVPKAFLSELEVPLPPLAEQRRVAALLDKADALRATRRETIAKLDRLLQAAFLEMFGDPKTNPRHFPIRPLSEFYVSPDDGTRCGPFGSALKKADLTESGVPLWNMDNISSSGQMVMPFRTWLSAAKAKQLHAYRVRNGDILISRAGTVGKMCVARPQEEHSLMTTNLIRLRLGPGLIPEFFVALMTYCKGRVGRLKAGPDGGFTHMSTGILDDLSFPYPSVDLQRSWVTFAHATQTQKMQLTFHLQLLSKIFDSISNKAFALQTTTVA